MCVCVCVCACVCVCSPCMKNSTRANKILHWHSHFKSFILECLCTTLISCWTQLPLNNLENTVTQWDVLHFLITMNYFFLGMRNKKLNIQNTCNTSFSQNIPFIWSHSDMSETLPWLFTHTDLPLQIITSKVSHVNCLRRNSSLVMEIYCKMLRNV